MNRSEPETNRWRIHVKYIVDKPLATIALIVLAPLMLLLAIAIKLEDSGPAIFTQLRLGVDGQVFRLFKFRSMIVNADNTLRPDGSVDTTTNRITKTGKILRKTSLDELPQLYNILMGDMSFVGPRPTLPSHWSRYTERQKRRASVRPGLTGWAQVHGRNTLPWSRRIEYDLEYIDNFSLALDLRIMLMTTFQILHGKDIVIDRNPGDVDDLPVSTDAT